MCLAAIARACARSEGKPDGIASVQRNSEFTQSQERLRKATSRLLAQLMPIGYRFCSCHEYHWANKLLREPTIPGQPERFRQHDQMLMSIQFPRNLGIDDLLEIEVVDFEPRLARGSFLMDGVELAIDVGAELEIAIPEQAKPMRANLFRFCNNRVCLGRHVLAQYGNNFRDIRRIKKEISHGHDGTLAFLYRSGCRR